MPNSNLVTPSQLRIVEESHYTHMLCLLWRLHTSLRILSFYSLYIFQYTSISLLNPRYSVINALFRRVPVSNQNYASEEWFSKLLQPRIRNSFSLRSYTLKICIYNWNKVYVKLNTFWCILRSIQYYVISLRMLIIKKRMYVWLKIHWADFIPC